MVAGLAASALLATGVAAPSSSSGDQVDLVVQASSASVARDVVESLGGTVTRDLSIVDGVAASVSPAVAAALAASPDIRSVTPDTPMELQGAGVDSLARDLSGLTQTSVYPAVVGADRLLADGHDGSGVRVAVLDTGVSAVPDLAGRLVTIQEPLGVQKACVNLTGEPTCADGYGHGTFMAGIIAGSGASSGGTYAGVAPGADIVPIKVAGKDGSSDVSTVLAGIQWAVSFRQQYNIRVLNLSLGTDSRQRWQVDPLNYAVQKAWAEGIVVVVSASNRGPAAETISKPGDDPYVITVAAVDDMMTEDIADDRLPNFSGRGPAPQGVAKPDVVAPGGHIVSLSAPGSSIDQQFPPTMGDGYRSGSGTSMSTAVVSGVIAMMLDADPSLTPDRVKFALMDTARPVADPSPHTVGRGIIDGYAALHEAQPGLANQGLARSTGSGSLDLSRGSVEVSVSKGLLGRVVLGGLQTAQLLLFNPLAFLTGQWVPLTWYGSLWHLLPWLTTKWHDNTWQGHNWEGCSWGGESESTCLYGHNWEGSTWYGGWD